VTMQFSTIDQSSIPSSGTLSVPFVLSLSFASSNSVVNSPIISLTILTTISILLSTAGTLWGSQQKIKDAIILVTAKVKEFLENRRAANGNANRS
jgi:hypothetical protein